MSPISRRRFLEVSGAVGASALFAEGVFLEPKRLAVSEHTIGGEGGSSQPLRLAILTDLHLGSITSFHQRIADAVAAAEPDVVLLVGDSIDRADSLPLLGDFLALLPTGPRRCATLGNWEYWSDVDLAALRDTYARGDTVLLVNEPLALAPGKTVYGLDDSLAGLPSFAALEPVSDHDVVLLSHCPDVRDRLTPEQSSRFSAMISGHTHGGQIALGGWAPFRPPGSGDYVAGWYRGDGPDLFVSRGLGTSVFPVRLGSVPEVAILDWST